MTSPGQPGPASPAVPAEPVTIAQPGHPVHALTTFELRRYQRELEHAIKAIPLMRRSRTTCAANSMKSRPSRNHGPGSSTPAGKAPPACDQHNPR